MQIFRIFYNTTFVILNTVSFLSRSTNVQLVVDILNISNSTYSNYLFICRPLFGSAIYEEQATLFSKDVHKVVQRLVGTRTYRCRMDVKNIPLTCIPITYSYEPRYYKVNKHDSFFILH